MIFFRINKIQTVPNLSVIDNSVNPAEIWFILSKILPQCCVF